MSLTGATTLRTRPIDAEMSLAGVPDMVRRHSIGIVVALALAAVLVFPRWWVVASDPSEGARVPISPYGAGTIGYDESLYTPSIRQAFDGEIPVSDPYLLNHRDGTPQRNAMPHEAIGLVGRMTGDPFSALAIVTTAAAVAALLLLYAMLYRLTGSRWAAAALVPIVLMAIHVLNHAEGILPLRHPDVLAPLLKVDSERGLHAWARFPAPILVLAPFFALVLALPRGVEQGSRWWLIVSAVSLAALIYTYVYYWTAVGLAMIAWLAVLMLRGERAEAKRLVLVGVGALLLALPELTVLASSIMSLPADARDRVGLESPGIDTSMAITIGQRLLVGLPFLIAMSYTRTRNIFYAALFIAPLLLVALQGVVPQQWHYHTQVWGVFALPALVVGGRALWHRITTAETARPAALALAIIGALAFAYVVALQGRAISKTDGAFAVSQAEESAFSWIKANVGEEETVVSPSITTNLLLASLTSSSQYLAEGGFSIAEDEELIDRMLRVQAAYGYEEQAVFSRLDVHGEFDGFPVHDATGSDDDMERELEDYLAFFTFSFQVSDQDAFRERADSWRPIYRDLLGTSSVLDPRAADYLYCGHRERYFDAGSTPRGTYVAPAFESGDVAIYRLVDAGTPGATEFKGCG